MALILAGCGPSQEQHTENWYSAATWSSDGTQIAYFKRYVEYTRTTPRVSWFIGEDTQSTTLKRDQLFLCINDVTGKSERIISEVPYDLFQPDPYTLPGIYTVIVWENQTLLYGAGQRDIFATGVRRVNLQNEQDKLVEAGFEAMVALSRRRERVFNGQELYSSAEGDYGYFGDQTIYIFDHNRRSVAVYLHDPLNKKKPYVPPYSVTGK